MGSDQHVTIMELVELICELAGWRPREFRFDPTKPVGVYSRAADVTQMRERLRWTPGTDVREGVRRTLEWYVTVRNRDDVARRLGVLLTER